MICVQNVFFRYSGGSDDILHDINLTIRPGEFIAIMGPNGSGKSTVVKLLNGLLQPESGKIEIDGYNTANIKERLAIRQRVGLMVSNPDDAIVGSTVAEDLAFGPENLGLKPQQIKMRVDTALKMVSMEDKRGYPPHLLSGGQKQLLSLAAIMALEPDYFILDEPFAMLDEQSKKKLLQVLKQLQQQGRAIVLVTHSMEEAIWADRILLLADGRILADHALRRMVGQPELLRLAGVQPLEVSRIIEILEHPGLPSIDPELIDAEELVTHLCRYRFHV